jgi:CBS domain-containing protein
MTTAREMMHAGARCIGEHETLDKAAGMMAELGVGALPICGDDERLHGIITDRDIVIKCLAKGGDPRTMTASELAQGKPMTVEADTDLHAVLHMMSEHQIKRMPVVDQHRLVGMISESDLARHLSEADLAEFVEAVYARSGG